MGVFKLQSLTPKQVVIAVNAKDALTVALHPYVDSHMAYITVTRGREHILTIVNEDGTTSSFDWGKSGHTLVSKSMKWLRDEVVRFIEQECYIMLEWDDQPIDGAYFFYNDYYKKWYLCVENKKSHERASVCYETATGEKEMLEFAKHFLNATDWTPRIENGVQTWHAVGNVQFA